MGLFAKMGYNAKARAIAKKREMQELVDLDFEALVEKIRSVGREDFSLFADLTLYAYYRFPCAYTANNLIALYVDIYNGQEIDDTVELPSYDFFKGVGSFLEKASQVSDVFDDKGYFLSLAQYYLLLDEVDFQKAFSLLVTIPTSFMDEDTQYLTGMLYYFLGMSDIAKKVLETSISNMTGEKKATAGLVLAKLNKGEGESDVEYLRLAVKSKSEAVRIEASTLLNVIGRHDIVVDSFDFGAEDTNIRMYYEVALACKKTDNLDKFKPIYDTYEGDDLYDKVYELVVSGERVDVEEVSRAVNQERIDMIADSELYEYADNTTRRMLNDEIMKNLQGDTEFSAREYIALIPSYVD